jgi:hypothetical protein
MSAHLTASNLIDSADFTPVDHVLVFMTNLRSKKDVRKIEGILNQVVGREGWSLDLADVDKVLRIETRSLPPERVVQLLEQAGYCCAELPD